MRSGSLKRRLAGCWWPVAGRFGAAPTVGHDYRTPFPSIAALAARTSIVVVVCVALVVDSTAHAGSVRHRLRGRVRRLARSAVPRAAPGARQLRRPRTRFAGPKATTPCSRATARFPSTRASTSRHRTARPSTRSRTVASCAPARRTVTVECGNGRAFQYWHIEPVARAGQHAVAEQETLLGFIQPKREHVHLTHLERSRAVNPLAPGHLAPYHDSTRPAWSASPSATACGSSSARSTCRRCRFRPLARFPVSPALVTWRAERAGGVLRSGVARRPAVRAEERTLLELVRAERTRTGRSSTAGSSREGRASTSAG